MRVFEAKVGLPCHKEGLVMGLKELPKELEVTSSLRIIGHMLGSRIKYIIEFLSFSYLLGGLKLAARFSFCASVKDSL